MKERLKEMEVRIRKGTLAHLIALLLTVHCNVKADIFVRKDHAVSPSKEVKIFNRVE